MKSKQLVPPWKRFNYVYPVLSRRSRGISIGINLNPDKACNFDCIYCQVDRKVSPFTRKVDLDQLANELENMIWFYKTRELFKHRPFLGLASFKQEIQDIAFAGEGEPTLYPHFSEAVERVIQVKRKLLPGSIKLVLITNSTDLTRKEVQKGLVILHENGGEIWAKLDAGTQDFFNKINRTLIPFEKVVQQLKDISRQYPIVLQTLLMQVRESSPEWREILKYCERVQTILSGGGKIKAIQVYTVARKPTEKWVAPLSEHYLKKIAGLIHKSTGIPVETYT